MSTVHTFPIRIYAVYLKLISVEIFPVEGLPAHTVAPRRFLVVFRPTTAVTFCTWTSADMEKDCASVCKSSAVGVRDKVNYLLKSQYFAAGCFCLCF
jgi:hypothetical protein